MLYYLYSALMQLGTPQVYGPAGSLYKDPPAIVAENIYIGSISSAMSHGAHFAGIVNLSGVKYEAPPGVSKLDIVMPDTDIGDNYEAFIRCFQTGSAFISRVPGPVLIHCMAGVNRSATLVAWHLIDRGWKFDDARRALAGANATRRVPLLTNKSFVRLLATKSLLHACPGMPVG